jgi:hypothetical protein
MTEPDDANEARLRRMFRDAAADIHPRRPLNVDALPLRAPGRTTWGLSLGLAVCVVAAAAITLTVHPWSDTSPGGATGDAGILLTVKSDGAVETIDPESGTVLRTLVGRSPVDSTGRHLSQPTGITAADDVAYIAYDRPSPVIESIPLGGGTPTFVTDGTEPAASADGTKLAFWRLTDGSASDAVVVRDLATGLEQIALSIALPGEVNELSWSPGGNELALSGLFRANTKAGSLPLNPIVGGVELLALDQPLSATNPHFLGTPTGSADFANGTPAQAQGQFLAAGGDVAVVFGKVSGVCQPAHATSVQSVDPTSGQATTMAYFPFVISNPVFDQTGRLIAFERSFAVSGCPPVRTTTTTTTTATTPPGRLPGISVGGGTTGSGSLIAVRSVLYRWSDGKTIRLAGDVADVTFVAAAP